jgi:hypothetical protein
MRSIEKIHEDQRKQILKQFDLDAISKKRAELKAAGTIADKLENLTCKLHDGSALKIVTDEFSPVQYAVCEPCVRSPKNWEDADIGKRVMELSDGKLMRPYDSDSITDFFKGTAAYKCEQQIEERIIYEHVGVKLGGCGWVLGRPRKDVDMVSEETEPDVHVPIRHFGYVDEFYCGVCGIHIGTYDMRPKIVYESASKL